VKDLSANGDNADARHETPARPAAAARRRTPWPLAVVAVLFVVVPFLTWYLTWFGRPLSDEKIDEYLRGDNARHAQHALSQVAERLAAKDESARRWFPQILALAESPVPDLRMTAAWVMGEEHRSEEFRAALLKLIEDPEPIVRRNAALALVRFGDARCRPELLAMLRPYPVTAHAAGKALPPLSAGTPVRRGSVLVRFEAGGGRVEELRSPLPGRVEQTRVEAGQNFAAGDELFRIAPDEEQARDALVGLAYFGEAEDLNDIERYAQGVERMPESLKKQAALTAEAVRRRSTQGR
jgi:biotin carboxyl carrier protein